MFKFFENLIDPYKPYDLEETPPKKLWPFMRLYLRTFDRLFMVAGLFSIIVAAIEIFLIWYLGRIVTVLTQSSPKQFWNDYGTELIWVVIFILLVRPVLQIVDVLLLNNSLLPNVGTLVRYRAHRHVLRQSTSWFENDFAGRIANRIMQTPPAFGEVVFQIFDALTFSVAYLVGALLMLYGTDARLSVPLLIWFVFFAGLVVWTVKRVGPASKAASDARSQITGRVVDTYSNIHTAKIFDHDEGELAYAKEAIENGRKTFQKEMRIYTIMDFGMVVLNGLLIVGVVGWALWLWAAEVAPIGVVAAAAALTLRLNGMSGWIMWATTSFFRELGVVSEGMETIAHPIALKDRPNASSLDFQKGEIRMQGIRHHYGKGAGGLDDINLVIAPGEKIGLVGKSGAGKSTLIKLILRFFDPESGQILIDGQDISSVTQSSLRRNLAVVQQDSSLLHRSVLENIAFGQAAAADTQIKAAIENAKATEFIKDLKDQDGRSALDARVGERGVKLSGGQRQRISLARVFLKNAPILILDEATSALDSEVEAEIQNALYEHMEGKTVIAIAHRLSTIAKMDRIIVLDEGKIIEEGSHKELLELGGVYGRMWERQSGGFLDSLND